MCDGGGGGLAVSGGDGGVMCRNGINAYMYQLLIFYMLINHLLEKIVARGSKNLKIHVFSNRVDPDCGLTSSVMLDSFRDFSCYF